MRPAIGGGLDLAVAGDGILISTFLCTNSHKKWTKKRGAAHRNSRNQAKPCRHGKALCRHVAGVRHRWTWRRGRPRWSLLAVEEVPSKALADISRDHARYECHPAPQSSSRISSGNLSSSAANGHRADGGGGC